MSRVQRCENIASNVFNLLKNGKQLTLHKELKKEKLAKVIVDINGLCPDNMNKSE